MVQMPLEIVVEKALGLEKVHSFHSLKPYPVVSICEDGDESYDGSDDRKLVDPTGGSNPVWRAFFQLPIDFVQGQQKPLLLIVGIKSLSSMACLPDKYVGEVRVPIEELLKDIGDGKEWISTERPVRNHEGKEHGSLTFSYKIGKPLDHPPAALRQPTNENSSQNPKKCNKVHPIIRAIAVGGSSASVTALIDALHDL